MTARILLFLCLFPSLVFAGAPPQKSPFDFRYLGESLLSLDSLAERLAPARRQGSIERPPGKPLSLRGEGTVSFAVPVPVEKEAEYLVRVRVKSAGPVVLKLGSLIMAYNDLGHEQTVAGLYRNNQGNEAKLEVELRPAEGANESAAEIASISFIRVERPQATARKPSGGSTLLVLDGKPAATIVIPADAPAYREMAEKIAGAVKEKAGVALPVVTDREATDKEFPALREPYRSGNLILLGRLGNNRAFWAAYNHFLTAVDGYYPGGNGYALHTAANVFHNGKNHLIVGGTTDEGAARGAEKLVEAIHARAEVAEGGLRLPWLLDIDLQGECLAFFKREDAKWDTENPLLPKPEPGYGNVTRWYQNTMGYYWTGWESFKKRADRYLAQVLGDKAITHHYIIEFLVRTFDMVDESGLLDPGQVRQMDELITSNFLDCMTVSDLGWMTTFAPPYGQVRLVNRHQIAPWMGDYKMAEFVTDALEPQGGMKELAEFRRMEKERLLDDFVAHRSGPSLPGGVLDEVYEEVNAVLFRFALDHERYAEFFGSGNARKALALERIDPLTGRLSFPGGNRDSKLVLGIMASLTKDPALKWLWHHLPESVHARGYFQGRYLGQVRRYTPDAAAPEKVPTGWNGFHFMPTPVENDTVRVTPEKYFFVSYGTGFEPTDDYLAFSGPEVSTPSGVLARLVSGGSTWISGSEDGSRFGLNTASVTRIDDPDPAAAAGFKEDSRCFWSGELSTGDAIRFYQRLSPDIAWTRDFVALQKGVFVFRDEFTALRDGIYSINVTWNPTGGISTRKGNRFTYTQRGGKLDAELIGEGFTPKETRSGGEISLRNGTLRKLARGEKAVSYTIFQASTAHRTVVMEARLSGENLLTLGSGEKAMRLAFDPPAAKAFKTDAALVVEAEGETGFYHCKTVEAKGRPPVSKPKPESFALSAPDLGAFKALAAEAKPAPIAGGREGLSAPVEPLQTPWRTAWSYDGFLRPARVTGVRVVDGVIDLGRVLPLAEIRASTTGPAWTQGRLPETLLLATEAPGGNEVWKPAQGERHWRPGVRTANYGEAHPEPQTDEALKLENTPARYVKAEPAAPLIFFTSAETEARHPMRVEAGDFLGDGTPQIFVKSDVFPQFPRPIRDDDLSAALLRTDGTPFFQLDFSGPVQGIRMLDRHGEGKDELFALYANGTLEIYGLDGQRRASADLYRFHQQFQRASGRPNTRTPAGGYVLPFAVGLWRQEAGGGRKIIVSRYGGLSFLNADLSFQGVLNETGYGTPGLLEAPLDFGSGEPEQVCMERFRFWQIGGEGKPVVRDPQGAKFWPQVYEVKSVSHGKAFGRIPLGGYPTVRFEPLGALTAQPRYLLYVRGGTVGLYDGRERKVAYEWHSQAPVFGAGILTQREGNLELLVATADSLLWKISWPQGVEARPVFEARTFPDTIRSIEEKDGTLILAGDNGLYLRTPEGAYRRIAEGAFQSAALFKGKEGLEAAAVTARGEVKGLKPAVH